MDSCGLFAVVFVCVKVCPYGIVLRVVTPVVFPFLLCVLACFSFCFCGINDCCVLFAHVFASGFACADLCCFSLFFLS